MKVYIMPRGMYPNKYEYGKQQDLIPFDTVKKRVVKAKLSEESEAFFWLLYYCSIRKSEAYERVAQDFKITESHLIVDFHQRKKHGAEVDPLELPLTWYGVDKIVKQIEKAKLRAKTIFTSEPTGKTRLTKKGKEVPIKKRVGKRVRAHWVFPNIQSTKAWEIVKKVLGKKHYPHYLRLLGLSEIGSDPTASILRLKSVSGIKSITALNAYLGKSKEEAKKGLEFRGRKFSTEW